MARARLAQRRLIETLNDLQHGDLRWKLLVIIGRYTSHIAIVVVAFVAVLLAGARLNSTSVSATATGPGVTTGADAEAFLVQDDSLAPQVVIGNGQNSLTVAPSLAQNYLSQLNQDSGLVSRLAVPTTSKPAEERRGLLQYTVQPNDNIESIAARFGLLPSTLVWANDKVEETPDQLDVGQILNILPVNGVYYTVQSGDTLDALAKKFKASVEDIVKSPYNKLASGGNLLPGTRVIIPDGVKPFVAPVVGASNSNAPARSQAGVLQPRASGGGPARAASGSFLYPTQGALTQNYWWGHRALDIANGVGTQIRAADNGVVVTAAPGWNFGYGNYVVIDHRNGFQTLYGHMSALYVTPGQPIQRGQVIGAMGTSGRSTGPHLHFEIRLNGVPQNPNFYLR